MPAGAAVVVMDTGARRALAGSAYNDRRSACEAAVAALKALDPGIRALRDVSAELLERGAPRLDPIVLKRARHVVPENLRPREMADSLRAGDLARAGRLMNDSHASLRDLYEVSCAELDLAVPIDALNRARHDGNSSFDYRTKPDLVSVCSVLSVVGCPT